MRRSKRIADLFASLPSVGDLRNRLAANIKERRLLRSLLRLAEKRADMDQTRDAKGPR